MCHGMKRMRRRTSAAGTESPAACASRSTRTSGRKLPTTSVVGRITMDLTIFDVTDVPAAEIRSGDYVELFGPNMPLDDVARAAGTIGYELLTSLGLRYERRYIYPE